MEYCWLGPWVTVLGAALYGPARPLLDPRWILVLLLCGDAAARVGLARAATLRRARVALVGVGLAVGLVAVHHQYYPGVPLWDAGWVWQLLVALHAVFPEVPQVIAGAAAAAGLWWRGLVLGMREVSAPTVEETYKTGVAMIVLYLLAAAAYGDTRAFAVAGTLPPSLPLFFAVGLSALALARLSAIWERGPDDAAWQHRHGWLLLVAGVVGAILVVAGAAAGVATADVQRYLGLVLAPLAPLLEGVFLLLVLAASVVARVLLLVLERLPRRAVPPAEMPGAPVAELLRRLRDLDVHPHVIEGARWSMAAALLLALVAGMAITLALTRRRVRSADGDEHESVWSLRAALAPLAAVLARSRLPDGGREERTEPAASVIRRIYRDLLALGARLGAPRAAWATPREHAPRLRAVLPAAASEVEALTWAYERVRYGRWRPSAAGVQDALAAWRRVQALERAAGAGGVPARPARSS